MILDQNTRILIVGLGLMGGSYAEVLSQKGFEVGALERKKESLDYALEKGTIRHGRTDVDPDYIAGFDLVIFALYPHAFIEWIKTNQQYLKKGALLTDVTGVKGGVIDQVEVILRRDVSFIGAHPMAGRESSGVRNADGKIFKNANYIVTPTEKSKPEDIAVCEELGRILGFKTVTRLAPEEHDAMIGFLSQLTHCIAICLMDCQDVTHMARYTGDSFRDLTRIAKINAEMWSELFLMNKPALLKQMELFEASFRELKEYIQKEDAAKIQEMMRLSTKRREFFDR